MTAASTLAGSLILLSAIPAVALGQAPPPASIPLALAKEAADTALANCSAAGWKVGVTVVDAAGNARLTMVADGAYPMAGVYSGWKAKTAALLDESTASLKEKAKADPTVAQKVKDNGGGDSAGGQPLHSKGAVVGAIGVGGARGDQYDDACAKAAVAKIADRLR